MTNNIDKQKEVIHDVGVDNCELIRHAEAGDLEKMRAALASGAVVNTRDRRTGITALHAAAAGGHLAAVELLLEVQGIDPSISDRFGRSALDLALVAPYDSIVKVLTVAMANALDARDLQSGPGPKP